MINFATIKIDKRMKTEQKRYYEKPAMRVVMLQQHGMLCTSDTEPVRGGNSINRWGDGGTTDEDIYM